MTKFVVFGSDQHVYGLPERDAINVAQILRNHGHSVEIMSEDQYRHRHGYQGRISTD